MAIKKALGRRIKEPKTVQEIVNIMKELQEKGLLSTTNPQHEDIDLGWEDEMDLEENNLLTTYNPAEAMSNNVMIETIQKGPSHPDFKAILEEYKDIQFENMKELGRTNIIQHTIQLLDERPVSKGNRPLDQKDQIWIKQELKDLLERGIIRESTSSYSAPIVVVDKKTGDRRMCIDYRDLNAKTKKNSYPIPR